MATTSFRNLLNFAIKNGLEIKNSKKGKIVVGMFKGKFVKFPVHDHNSGKDIADGTFHNIAKQMGLANAHELLEEINSTK